MLLLASLLCGFVFGCGLLISGMVSAAKVLGFLDMFGDWDPTLAVVMAAAVTVTWIGFRIAARQGPPFFAAKCEWPTKTRIDAPLASGAVLFGVGWGLAGLCPGPAVVNLATLSPAVLVFVAAMIIGMALHDLWRRRLTAATRARGVTAVRVDG
jgi:uncharacterized membrane protein YedE/YeeE